MVRSLKKYIKNKDFNFEGLSQVEKMVKMGFSPDEIKAVFKNVKFEELLFLYKKYYKSPIELNAEINKRHFFRDKRYQKIKNRLRSNIKMQIAEMFAREFCKSIEEMIGYSFDELVIHIESTFQNGMTWENKGEWHIDHIKPRSKFSTNQIKECFAFNNLRAIWKEENLKKGASYHE